MNLFSAAGAGNNPLAHTWSLAGEMQFYLVWPIVVTMLAPLGRARAAWMLLIAWAVMTLARESARAVSVDWQVVYFAPWFHSSGMLLGGALALRPLSARFGQLGLAALIILLAFTPISQPIVGDPTHGRQIGTWAVAITEVAAALVIANPPAVLGYRPLPWLGRISYGLYLWHVPIIWALPVMAWPLKLCAVAGLSIAAAAASYYIVERRFLEPSGRRNLQHRLSAPEGSAGE
jgi:peptidoglycan/LPS O-acetylase OafA/YrhL